MYFKIRFCLKCYFLTILFFGNLFTWPGRFSYLGNKHNMRNSSWNHKTTEFLSWFHEEFLMIYLTRSSCNRFPIWATTILKSVTGTTRISRTFGRCQIVWATFMLSSNTTATWTNKKLSKRLWTNGADKGICLSISNKSLRIYILDNLKLAISSLD